MPANLTLQFPTQWFTHTHFLQGKKDGVNLTCMRGILFTYAKAQPHNQRVHVLFSRLIEFLVNRQLIDFYAVVIAINLSNNSIAVLRSRLLAI